MSLYCFFHLFFFLTILFSDLFSRYFAHYLAIFLIIIFFLVYLQLFGIHDCYIRVIHSMVTALLGYLDQCSSNPVYDFSIEVSPSLQCKLQFIPKFHLFFQNFALASYFSKAKSAQPQTNFYLFTIIISCLSFYVRRLSHLPQQYVGMIKISHTQLQRPQWQHCTIIIHVTILIHWLTCHSKITASVSYMWPWAVPDPKVVIFVLLCTDLNWHLLLLCHI